MKSRVLKLDVLVLLFFAFTFSVSAQEQKGPNFEKMFKRFDTDKNESISLDEWTSFKRKKEVPVERLEKNYAAMDADGDGKLTLSEMKANWGKGRGKKKGKK